MLNKREILNTVFNMGRSKICPKSIFIVGFSRQYLEFSLQGFLVRIKKITEKHFVMRCISSYDGKYKTYKVKRNNSWLNDLFLKIEKLPT